jgi:orotate phosphoribosyltransferase
VEPENESFVEDRQHLLKLIRERCYRQGKFTLSSGSVVSDYVDARVLTLETQGLVLASSVLYTHICRRWPDIEAVGGPAVAAVPLVAGLLCETEIGLRGCFIRDEPKSHGRGRQVEGSVRPGDKIVLLDDVVTTGKSLFMAVNAAREFGLEILGITALVDRDAGAHRRFVEEGLDYEPLFSLLDIKPLSNPPTPETSPR